MSTYQEVYAGGVNVISTGATFLCGETLWKILHIDFSNEHQYIIKAQQRRCVEAVAHPLQGKIAR